MTTNDERFMSRCFELARKGWSRVNPNPMVGAVVVEDGTIRGEGFHAEFGGEHAEIAAMREAGDRTRGATLYINLEPCNHFGKTPPCTQAIIQAGIKSVVYAMKDPNPRVTGGGDAFLRAQGIEVSSGILEAEAERLNEAFSFSMRMKIPYVTLKIAQTIDGYIADSSRTSKWITGDAAREKVRSLRMESDAILVGAGTAITDDPMLTVRDEYARQPLRIVLDGRCNTPADRTLFTDKYRNKTVLIASSEREWDGNIEKLAKQGISIVRIPGVRGRLGTGAVLNALWERNVNSLLVEGGSSVFGTFLESGLFARMITFIAPVVLIDGVRATQGSSSKLSEARRLHDIKVVMYGDDIGITGYSDLFRSYMKGV